MVPPVDSPSDAGTASSLVVSYCFPPYSDTAAVVAAKRVREMGVPVDVVYNAMDSIRTTDASLLQLCGGLVRRHAALRSPTAFSNWASMQSFTYAGSAQVAEWEGQSGPYARVYSRAQFAASHILTAKLALDRPELRWVAEFSDPLSHDAQGAVRRSPLDPDDPLAVELWRRCAERGVQLPGDNALEWAEVLPFLLADEILFTNPNQRDLMLERCHDQELADSVRSRAVVSPHPTLPRSFYHRVGTDYELPRDRKNIAYFGNFYANRGLGAVLDAMVLLPQQARERIALHVFTSKQDVMAADTRVAELGESVRINPYVRFLEFLNLSTQMDVLLVNDAVTPEGYGLNPFLPSKVSDYLGAGTDIWGMVEPGSPLDGLDIAYRSAVDHVTAATHVLSQIADSATPEVLGA